ncbi:MAG: phenylalanine--tRNA ligase subunit beta [Marinifilaceae bacterium]
MNISLNWLKEYIDINLPAEEIAKILTNIGLEVGGIEEFESIRGGLKGLVVGEVKTCEDHADSDHLHVTTVDLGNGEFTPIVCGAPNVAAGQKVIVATVGTVLYDGDNEFVIKKSKIRGEVSEGMICAEDEIGVGASHDGIIVLPAETPVGMPAAEYYNVSNDTIIEVDITPNRIDGASVIGVARDLAAYLKQTDANAAYKLPSVEDFKVDRTDSPIAIRIERAEACHRYAGICVENVKVAPSPEWLQSRLRSIGLTPINNVVDVTNFILFELGQPLHAFDKAKIKGNEVVVKTMEQGTKFVTLDGVERTLDKDDLMICNENEPMCIAGVFGGLESGITEQTTNVFIESAYFDSVFVRKTARRHGLSTDASFRFERGTDPNMVIRALKRAALLIKEVAGGEIASEIIDIYPTPVTPFEVTLRYAQVDRLLGKQIGHDTIKSIVTALEMEVVSETAETLVLNVPVYRVDVQRECDVIEDILRIYGFNNIEVPAKVNSTLGFSHHPDDYKLKNNIGDMLAANGFAEIMNNSLTKSAYFEEMESFKADNTVILCNPLSSDLNAMRQSLLFGGLESLAYNINRRSGSLRMFEFGKSYTFHLNDDIDHHTRYREEDRLALFITGSKDTLSWNAPEVKSDFFNLKAYCEMILTRLGIKADELKTESTQGDIYRDGLDYYLNGQVVLSMGIVSKKVLKRVDIKQDVFYAEFSWEALMKAVKNKKIVFVPMPKFPAVKRDLALLVDKKVTFKELRDIAYRTEKKLLTDVTLFDVYEGEKLGADKKSYALSYTILDTEKTLTDKQIDKIMNKLIGTYKHQLGAEIR